jgi:hypothetical protein
MTGESNRQILRSYKRQATRQTDSSFQQRDGLLMTPETT